MSKRTTIRLQISPSEVLASLTMIEKLGGNTTNRTFSSCCQQLYLSMLTTAMKNASLEFAPSDEAARELKKRAEDAIDTSPPLEELNLLENQVEQELSTSRMNKIKQGLEDFVPPQGSNDMSDIFGINTNARKPQGEQNGTIETNIGILPERTPELDIRRSDEDLGTGSSVREDQLLPGTCGEVVGSGFDEDD